MAVGPGDLKLNSRCITCCRVSNDEQTLGLH